MFRTVVRITLIATFVFSNLFSPGVVSADFVWNPQLGKFVSADTVVLETPREQFRYAEELEKEGNSSEAAGAYDNLFRQFPNSPLAQEALLRLGALQEKKREYLKAFNNYQKIVDYYPHTDKLDEVTEKQFRIGNLFLSGERGRIFGIPILPSQSNAIKVFEKITENAPFSAYGMKSQFYLGVAYRNKGDLKKTIEQFRVFIDNYPVSELKPEAYFQIAEATYLLSQKKQNDGKALQEAEARLYEFLEYYPDTPQTEKVEQYIATLQSRDAKRLYDIARFYERESFLESALMYYKELIEVHPESEWSQQAQKRLDAFEDPEKFLLKGRTVLVERLAKLRQQKGELERVARDEKPAPPEVKTQIDTLNDQIKEVEKDLRRMDKEKKKETKLRWEDLRRKKRELKERRKKLGEKEKHLAKNPSEDLEKAIVRWKEALESEEYALDVEQRQLLALERRLGIHRIMSLADVWGRPPRGVEDIKRFKADALTKIVAEEDRLKEEKQKLFARLDEVQREAKDIEQRQLTLLADAESLSQTDKELLSKQETALDREREKLEALHVRLEKKNKAYKDLQGFLPALMRLPLKPVSGITKVFTKKTSLEKVEEQLSEAEWEKDNLMLRLTEAEEELARFATIGRSERPAQKIEPAPADSAEPSGEKDTKDKPSLRDRRLDQRAARKKVMSIEKKIHQSHNKIEDAHKQKDKLVNELDEAVGDIKRTSRPAVTNVVEGVTAPARLAFKGVHAFLFGLKEPGHGVKKEAERIDAQSDNVEDREIIQYYKQAISKQEEIIKKNELEIIALELELESLITDVKGSIRTIQQKGKEGKQRKEELSAKREIIAREVENRKKLIAVLTEGLAVQEQVVEGLRTQRAELMQAEGLDVADTESVHSEETAVDADAKEISKEEKASRLESEINELRKSIKHQEKVVEEKERSFKKVRKEVLARSKKKPFWKIEKSAEDQLKEELADALHDEYEIKKDIINIINRQESVSEKHRAALQDKLNFVKKRIEKLEKYQGEELVEAKKIQKDLFEGLDAINSELQMLAEERIFLE